MNKNVTIGILLICTAIGGFATYQASQKSTALSVLLDDKAKTLAVLEDDKNQLSQELALLKAKVSDYERAEKQRQLEAAALNAANVDDADLKEFGEPCRIWIAQNFGDKDHLSTTLLATTISDSWTKKGLLVFEVATPSSLGSTNSLFLCIVDKKKGSMFKPSAFETADWRREF